MISVPFRYYQGVGDTIGRVFSESVIISRQLRLEEVVKMSSYKTNIYIYKNKNRKKRYA